MPKVAQVGKFRKTAAESASQTKDAKDASTLSRGQKKRLAKREQYLRREKLVMSSLRLQRQEEQKKRIDGMDAIKEALLSTVSIEKKKEMEPSKKPNLLKSNKSRKKLVEKEVTQISLVMEHPAFKADPFATIREHLKNTIAEDSELQKKEQAKHLKERKQKEEQKKVAKKEQGIKKKRKKFKATRSKAR